MKARFTKDYVLKLTAGHMRRCIDISIGKTFDRVGEFADDPVISKEIFETLSHLHTLRRQLDVYQLRHAEDFGNKPNAKSNQDQ
jgi:hypothetical protein